MLFNLSKMTLTMSDRQAAMKKSVNKLYDGQAGEYM
jgi:hypothetical protein